MNLFSAIILGASVIFFGDTGQAKSLSQEYTSPLSSRHHPHHPEIHARLPPTLNNTTSPYWTPTPPGWFYGNWKVTHSSIPVYLTLLNMQFDSAPLLPSNATLPGQNSDLTTYQLPNNSRIFTAYGIDTPHPGTVDVYDFAGTGKLTGVNNTWELLAWGTDTCGDEYMLIYETPVAPGGDPAGLDIESRVEGGPSAETLEATLAAVRGLGSKELTRLVGNVKTVPDNGARRGLPPVVCDESCRENLGQ